MIVLCAKREPCRIRRGRRWRSAVTDTRSRRRWSSPLSSAYFLWDWTSARRETRSWSDSPRAASHRYRMNTHFCFSDVWEPFVMKLNLFCRKTLRTRCERPYGTTSTCRERWAALVCSSSHPSVLRFWSLQRYTAAPVIRKRLRVNDVTLVLCPDLSIYIYI